MQASGKRSLANVAAAILLAGVLVSATLILVPLSRSPTTITEVSVTATTQTTTSTQTITSTSTSVTTDYIPINGSGDSALLADCSPSQNRGYSAGTLTAGASSPAIICVQIYWFNPTTPFVLNAMSLLQIEGYAQAGAGQPFDGGANFTVTASVDQLLLGGPTGANEGTILAFAITAKPGASGTYQLAVAQAGLFLADQGGQRGGVPNGILVAGTGQPDYVQSNVIFLPVYVNCTSGFQIQGMAYGMCSDILYYRFMVVTNSTQ